MSKVLKSLQLVTQSYSGTPSTNTGAIYASGSSLYFENANGTIFPLGSTTNSGYISSIREYTGSAPGGGNLTYTWYNPSNIRYIQVICVGGGGGGGCGTNPFGTTVASSGGSGGGGGAIAWGFFDKNMLTQPSYSISVGAGGAGGTNSAVSQAVRTGQSGQYTTFGDNMVSASGGSGGTSQVSTLQTAGGAGGLAALCRPGPGFAIPGGDGAQANLAANAVNATDFFFSPLLPFSTAGGGAGGGRPNAGTIRYSGSFGAGGYQYNTLQSNNLISANSGSPNLVSAAVLLQFTSSIFPTTYGLGGGGNGVTGSGADIVDNQVPGGNGGLYGAGGGGSTWRNSGGGGPAFPGGSGSSGLCIVIEYY
jgi:hypothetical protein